MRSESLRVIAPAERLVGSLTSALHLSSAPLDSRAVRENFDAPVVAGARPRRRSLRLVRRPHHYRVMRILK